MTPRHGLIVAGIALATLPGLTAANASAPENLAPRAEATATSEHNASYLAKFVIDGQIPAPGSQSADLGAAWCVKQSEARDRADLTLRWPTPTRVGQIIYWGRTAWMTSECWKDYEVLADDDPTPIAAGSFNEMHGPQPVAFEPRTVTSLTLRFKNSHGGANPGASEIQVFERPLTDQELATMRRKLTSPLKHMPWVEETDVAALADLLGRPVPEDIADDADALERMEREALLRGVDRIVAIRRHEINASHVYTYHYEGFQPGGGVYILDPRDWDAEPVELVASPEGQILDLDLSYDGSTILFSWRRTVDEGYHLWTVDVDGRNLTQVTDGPWHDYNACWLPDGDIAFLSSRSPQFAYCWHAPVGTLYRMARDGSKVVKLSANYLNDFTPAVLADGRILYSRWEYVDRPAIPIQSLWTINPDGTALSVYFGNRVLSPGTFMEARSVPGTSRILCTMTGHNGPTRGAIGLIDRRRGVNAQDAIVNLTPDTPVPNVDQGNGNTSGAKQYSGPYPLDQDRFLCSIRGPLLVRTIDGRCQAMAYPPPDDGMQWLCARPLRPRERPPILGAVDPGAAYDAYTAPEDAKRYATLYLQDVHRGLAPTVERGEVAAIRVVREMQKTVRIDPDKRAFGFQFPVISCGATYAGKTVLGDVPVDKNGSAVFRVPAGMPIYFIALDREGRAIQRMRSFTHLMPGEVQGCIGCHEHRLSGPPSASEMIGVQRPVDPIEPDWGVRGFDFSRIVQPVLDKHCATCHNPVDAPKGIDLSNGKTDFFNVAYDVLARERQGGRGSPYVNWIPTYNGQEWNILEVTPRTWGSYASPLAEVVQTGHPDENGEPRIQLTDTERRRIFAWIDLNVPYYGSSETAYPDAIGCRRAYPTGLDAVLEDVAKRRCAECHEGGAIPRREWTRVTAPEWNPFLVAPLAKSAGGSERCGRAVFADKNDPDYRAILDTFAPVSTMLETTPRMDMDGGRPAPDVCRLTQ